MFFTPFMRDANKTALAIMESSMERARSAQEAMMKQGDLVSKMKNPWQIPVMGFKAQDPEATREAFHKMADANMKAWEKAAQAYAATPGWMKLPYKVPGEFWSKWFDQWQQGKFDTFSASSMEAAVETMTSAVNRASAEPADATDIPTATAKAAKGAATKAAAKASQEATETIARTAELVTETVLETTEDTTTAVVEATEAVTTQMPVLLKEAEGTADDLTVVKGIGPKLSETLNEFGVFHFKQIASWTPENISWLDEELGFKGRIQRDGWVDQAIELLKPTA